MFVNSCRLGGKFLQKTLTIPDGFGQRLREERASLGLSQEAFAGIGGVKRLTQMQYEKEASSPTVQYLASVASAGVNLDYLLFGRQPTEDLLSYEKRYLIDGEAFCQVESFVQNQPGSQLGAEGRFALFQSFRANLIRDALVSSVMNNPL